MIDRTSQQLGNYRLLRLLGRGGFAEVYLGEHRWLKDLVAIKILHKELQEDDIKNFQREAQTIAMLKHPYIIRVRDFDIKDNIPFLVMDYVPNGSLKQRHRDNSLLPLPLVASYLEQLANALQYAHERKIIHRDVKPDNMLINENEQIMLSDFGIAAIAHSTASQRMETIVGTIAYMAPEQIQGFPHFASDQYALGIVAYEWICGQKPFQGSFVEIAAQHTNAPPPLLRQRLPTVSIEVERVIARSLAKSPGARFSTVEEFANAFKMAVRHQPDTSQTEPPSSQLYSDNRNTLEPTIVATPAHSSGENIVAPTESVAVINTFSSIRKKRKPLFAVSRATFFYLLFAGLSLLLTLAGWNVVAPLVEYKSYQAGASINTIPADVKAGCLSCSNSISIGPGEMLQFNGIHVDKSEKYIIAIYTSNDYRESFYISINGQRKQGPIAVSTSGIPVLVDAVLSVGNNSIALYNSQSNSMVIYKITVRPSPEQSL